jgi:hypothetical protein
MMNHKEEKFQIIKDIGSFNKKLLGATTTHMPPGASGYGIRIFNANGEFIREEVLLNEMNDFNYFLSITNANPYDDVINFMIIIDNQIVPFKVDKSSTYYENYELSFKPYSLINLPISFALPDNLSKKNKYKIQFICQTKADKKTIKETEYIFSALAYMSKFIEVEEESPLSFLQISDLKDDSSFVTLPKESTNNDSGFVMEIKADSNQTDINEFVFEKGETLNFSLSANGENTFYSSIVFVDNNPITLINNSTTLNWKLNKNKQLNYNFSLDPLQVGVHTIFALTIPNNKDTSVFETRKYTIEIK